MLDHFQNMFDHFQKLFGKKKFLDFPADQFFFFTEIFLKKISGACPPGKMYTDLKKT